MFGAISYLILLAQNLNNPTLSGNFSVGNTQIVRKTISLNERYEEKTVNDVFKDNILLTLNYMEGNVKNKSDIDWSEIEKPRNFEFSLKPNEGFAFHDQVLDKFKESTVKTTNAHFNFQGGFKSDGYLYGDGVCHLASLMYWAAKDADLNVTAPTNHDFATINSIPKEYGVSIYDAPGKSNLSANQNLYITNTSNTNVTFVFNYDGENLSVNVVKTNS